MGLKKAVVYARVSTDHEDQLHSFKSQQEYYTGYAIEHGYDLIHLYADEGLSATSSNRKEFLKMLYDAGLDFKRKEGSRSYDFDESERLPMFNWIIVKDISRFSRNIDTVTIIRLLRNKNVYVIFESMGFTTKDSDWEFRYGLFVTFTQQESIDRSMKGKKAYQIRSDKGEFHMSNVLLGYKRIPGTKMYEIDENEAKIVRYIFDLYVNHGKGSTEIADICNEEGYRTKKGKRFNSSSISRIIKNEKFKGLVITNRYTHNDITGNHKRIELPEEKWKYNYDAIPKIISVEMFDKAQEIRNKRIIETKNHGRKGKKPIKNEFYKMIYCGKCGADYVRLTAKKKRENRDEEITEYFYSCRNRRNSMRLEHKCDNKGIAHNVLVRELNNIAEKLHDKFNFIRINEEKEALNRILSELDIKLENGISEKQLIKEQVDELNRQRKNLVSKIAKGVSESVEESYQEMIDELKDEINRLEVSMLEYDIIQIEKEKQEYLDKYEEIYKFSKKKTFTYGDVASLIEKIHVLPHREALVELKTPTLLLDDEVYKGETNYALLPFTFNLR